MQQQFVIYRKSAPKDAFSIMNLKNSGSKCLGIRLDSLPIDLGTICPQDFTSYFKIVTNLGKKEVVNSKPFSLERR